MYLDTYLIEKLFLELDKNFPEIRRLKELYIDFNQAYVGDTNGAADRLDELIKLYKSSNIALFKKFSDTCEEHRTEIINSFNTTESLNKSTLTMKLKRISNGPMESFNNVPKDYKRVANSLSNFKFVRNRILFSTRKEAPALAVPKTKKEVNENSKTNTKRGSYKKYINKLRKQYLC